MTRRAISALLSLALLLAQVQPALAQTRIMPSGEVTIPAGSTSAEIEVLINGDTTVEPDENYTLTVQSSVPVTKATATGTIVNDDGIVAPTVAVSGPTSAIDKGSNVTFTITRSGDTSASDRVRWAVVPLSGDVGADEDNFPAVWSDEFTGSAISDLWCVSDDAGADEGCRGAASQPLNGAWDADLVSVGGGSLSLGILESTGNWTSAQVHSKRAFQGGLLRYSVTLPAGAGGAHSVWRAPEAEPYGSGRSGEIIDLRYTGSTSGNRDKEWRSAITYSPVTTGDAPEITDRLVSASSWAGSAHTGQTRWIGDEDAAQLFFSVDGTTYWSPPSSSWPDTRAWQQATTDEDGNPETINWPAGGGASPIDGPFYVVLQSGVAGAADSECSGETTCPAPGLSGAAVTFDWIRYYQYPAGEAVLQPGSDRVNVSLQTAENAETGNRQFKFVLLDADSATVSANNEATATIVDDGTTPTDPGEETYALDFGLNAGNFTDQFGVRWERGNQYVTGGTAIADTTTTGGAWTPNLDPPPTMRAGYVTVSNKCPFDGDFPSAASLNGKDVKYEWPTDRRCLFPVVAGTGRNQTVQLAGTNNPGARIWSVGGDFYTNATHVNAGDKSDLLRFQNYGPGAELFIEGAIIDSNGSCNDTVRPQGSGASGPSNPSKLTIQNTIMRNTDQCERGHGDTLHMGTGAWATLKMQNVHVQPRFQGTFVPHRPSNGHGALKVELDHVFAEEYPGGRSARSPGGGVWLYLSRLGSAQDNPPPQGIDLNEVFVWSTHQPNPADSRKLEKVAPRASSLNAQDCAVYTAAQRASQGAGLTGTWCWGRPPGGTFVPENMVGRNYSRAAFTGAAPISIQNAAVPRLDTTRMTGSTMNIAVPVDISRGSTRLITMGFSARDETAAGQRVFDISGATSVSNVDIYARAGGRDTETTIQRNVTVPSDGVLRLALTGKTGQAQINWMKIERSTIGVTLNKATYNEGDTMTMTFRRDGPTDTSASMGWRIGGTGGTPASASDFVGATTGTAVFGSGATTVTQTKQIVSDNVAEPAEGFAVVLTGGTGADIRAGQGQANATIAASTGTPIDPCAPGGADYPCEPDPDPDPCEPGGVDYPCEPDPDPCPDDAGATVKTVRLPSGGVTLLRKAAFMTGPGLFRNLNTCGTRSTVVHGAIVAPDPKGTQPENPSPFLRVEAPADVPRRTTITDAFRFEQCDVDLLSCSPVRVELKITGR